MEIERKWLFDMINVPTGMCSKVMKVEQSYISIEPEVRLTKKSLCLLFGEEVSYWITIKGNGTLSRQEVEKELTEEEYKALLEVGHIDESKVITKKHWHIPIGQKHQLEISLVDKGTENEFVYGELEFDSEEEANAFKPFWWFGKEVTEDGSYKMKNYWKRTRL